MRTGCQQADVQSNPESNGEEKILFPTEVSVDPIDPADPTVPLDQDLLNDIFGPNPSSNSESPQTTIPEPSPMTPITPSSPTSLFPIIDDIYSVLIRHRYENPR